MKFSLNIGMCDASHYTPLAQAAEAAGFDSIAVPDSLCYPEVAETKYPYNADGSRNFLENEPFIESLIAITHMAAVTKNIKFCTYVYKLAIRQPAMVAKQVQGIQALSGNRLKLGVGISPWEEDFAVADVPWKGRGKRFDEQIQILRGLDSGEYFSFEGDHIQMPSIKMCPTPEAPTPIMIGGQSEVAFKRAARLGDGWMAVAAEMDQLTEWIGKINAYREEFGTADKPFEFWTTGKDAFTEEGIIQLEKIGINEVVIGFRNPNTGDPDLPLEDKIKMTQWYGKTFIK